MENIVDNNNLSHANQGCESEDLKKTYPWHWLMLKAKLVRREPGLGGGGGGGGGGSATAASSSRSSSRIC